MMKNRDRSFVWSNGWWLEKDGAWFIDGARNILFTVNMETGECEYVDDIPEPGDKFRLTPSCLKCGSNIFCFPGCGSSIWIYNLDKKNFAKMEVEKPKHHQWGVQFWIFGDKILIAAAGWNKIIEVSIRRKSVTNYYAICEKDNIKGSVLADGNIYAISSAYSRIYQFDILTKKVIIYPFQNAKKRFATICFDGEKFWMSGYRKELYIWEKGKNSLVTVNDFPPKFEINNMGQTEDSCETPVFNRSIFVGGYIWFIPTRANKILYADKDAVLSVFDIIYEANESEDNQLWGEKLGIGNYLLEYVKDDRYIGLFSARNSQILEIDTKHLEYQWKEYYFSDQYLQQYCAPCNGIYYENDDFLHSQAYYRGIQVAGYQENNISISVGMRIHTKVLWEDVK